MTRMNDGAARPKRRKRHTITESDMAKAVDFMALEPKAGDAMLAKHTGWTRHKARRVLAALGMKSGEASGVEPEMSGETITSSWGDNEGNLESKSDRILTAEDLLRELKVDEAEWKVERQQVTVQKAWRKNEACDLKWDEEGRMSGWKQDRGGMHLHPVHHVKVTLVRRKPAESAMAQMLRAMKDHSVKPDPAVLKRKQPVRKNGLRELEMGIFDPHLGMICRHPEGDGPQDMEDMPALMMTAVDDLVAKAEKDGPFAKAFMPVGNDWVHADNVWHTTTAGTGQPEMIDWHRAFKLGCDVGVAIVNRLLEVATVVEVYQIPGNHDRQSAFCLGLYLQAFFNHDPRVTVHADASPYKFHRAGVNLIGYEHGHSVQQVRLAALMANECRTHWGTAEFMEWHLGDQHRRGASKPAALEEQGVSVDFTPGLTAPNAWHRIKSFSHQQRGAMAWTWDHRTGPVGRYCFNVSKYTHKAMI